MSQFPGTFDESFGSTPTERPKTHGLAIAALVCSLIFFCPITTVLGPILGLIAIALIGSDPMKKGKGLAAVAIVLGLVITAGQIFLIKWGAEKFFIPVMKGPAYALEAGAAGDIAGFKNSLYGPGANASDEEAKAFLDEVEKRYGAFVSCMILEGQNQGQKPKAPFKYVIEFENKKVNAESVMVFEDPPKPGFVMKPESIIIFDSELGDLVYPMVEESQEP